MIFQLIYTCAMRADIVLSDLDEISAHIKRWSSERELTGISVCKDYSALQVLEGDKQAVMDIFKIISDDPRVLNPLVLIKRMTARREFLNWSTIYKNSDADAASFKLTMRNLSNAMPDDVSPETSTICKTFARVNGLTGLHDCC